MKCRRAFDVDLAAVVRGERDDADFLAHHPTCPDCATEVGVWRELDAMLRVGGSEGEAHPAPETLLGFADAPAALQAEVRGTVERHLAACRVCADEVRALGGFAAARAAQHISRAPAPSSAGVAPTVNRLARVVWHPAFAYAVVAVLLVPLLWDQSAHLTPEPAREARRAAPAVGERAASSTDAAAFREREQHVAKQVAEVAPSAPAPAMVEKPQAIASPPAAMAPPPPATAADSSAFVAARRARAPLQPPTRADAERQNAGGLAARAPAAKARVAESAPAHLADAADPVTSAPAGTTAEADRDEMKKRILEQVRREAAEDQIPPSARPRFLQVGPDGGAFVGGREAQPVKLRVVPPADLARGPLEVSVRGRAGQFAVALRVPDRAEVIEVAIPPHWLVPGQYSVVLQPVDAAGAPNAPPKVIGFVVLAPDAAR